MKLLNKLIIGSLTIAGILSLYSVAYTKTAVPSQSISLERKITVNLNTSKVSVEGGVSNIPVSLSSTCSSYTNSSFAPVVMNYWTGAVQGSTPPVQFTYNIPGAPSVFWFTGQCEVSFNSVSGFNSVFFDGTFNLDSDSAKYKFVKKVGPVPPLPPLPQLEIKK